MTDIQIEDHNTVGLVAPQMQIRAAFVKAWASFPSVAKDRNNKLTQSTYATLDSLIETIKPHLAENGLMVSQELRTSLDQKSMVRESCVTVRTTLYHSSGECIMFSPVTMPVVGKRVRGGGGEYSSDNGPQEYGSSITYARRYALLAALGISTGDDDDGNGAQGRHQSAHENRPNQSGRGSSLKSEIKSKKPETIGKDGAERLMEYASGLGVTLEMIREYLASKGKNHAAECEKQVEHWPAAWRTTISDFLKTHAAADGGEEGGAA